MNDFRSKFKKHDAVILQLSILKSFFQLEDIERFNEAVELFDTQERKRVQKYIKRVLADKACPDDFKSDIKNSYGADEAYFLEEMQKLSHELSIVALYKKIEIGTKRAVVYCYRDIKPESLFKIEKLIKELKKKGIDLTNVPHYKAMDELRCLNNSVKHSGVVDSELAIFPEWTGKEHEPLKDLDKAYNRLAPSCIKYFHALMDKLITARKSFLTTAPKTI
jgi:hypothetical protein